MFCVCLLVVCGIHIYMQGSQLPEEIKKWDVKILMVRFFFFFSPE